MPDGSTEKPEYPRDAAALLAFCVDGLDDPGAMIRRINHAERDDPGIPRSVIAEVREALWDRASTRAYGGLIGRPPSSFVGVARAVQSWRSV